MSGVVIAGGSVAGVYTARALRRHGYAGRVRVVEAEAELPYDKPPLSKTSLAQDPRVPLLTESEVADLGIELLLGRRVTELSTAASTVTLDNAAELQYDELVIATGAAARPAPWSCPGVHVLRSLADARGLRADLAAARHLLVIGAGFIGAEVASLARSTGIAVTLVDEAAVPMARVVGAALGERLAELHRMNSVDTRFGVRVNSLARHDNRLHAELSDGSVVEADTAVVGIGARLDLDWLEFAGLPVGNGVECDEYGRAKGFDKIHAVGDIAGWYQPRLGRAARIEHWTNAVEQADHVAQNIARPDNRVPYDPVPYVWSDQYDWRIQLIGTRDLDHSPHIIEQADPFRLAAVWRDDLDRVTGGMTVNWPQASVRLRQGISRGVPASEVGAQLIGASK
ncbi:NAD(P)/FAD-dependent oxidoreductase [Nocardia sp. SYP-A9097]|uniref:NAD(P)/FAD-dependent oxidoreductase n=1 Tax=Nocardia sp. SYP-A9097 TaxID=2663237 RepID=UPI00132700EE|nr:FAD-dependent oxidoreductase [Nocardia sp. SYP-A9097]MRH91785.1 NAD(P)/FAD-dependent oxidoreductase [Nocardia sp. SYP-A9097]